MDYNQHLFPTVLKTGKSKIKVLAHVVSGEGPLPGSWRWPLMGTGLIGEIMKCCEISGGDDCTTQAILKATELYSHFESMSFMVCELYLELYLKLCLMRYHYFTVFFIL